MSPNTPWNPGIWQISALAGAASYAEVFIKNGVALIGPGDAGEWRPDHDDTDFEGSAVRRFATEVKQGDVFLLRTAANRISAVGLVASDYLFSDQFDDVYGRDLQHARRVRWCLLPQEYGFVEELFGSRPPRFSRTESPDVQLYVQQFLGSPPTWWQTAPLPSLPKGQPEISEVPSPLTNIVSQVADLVPLYQDSRQFGNVPTEDEMIAHFVAPFLKGLGWPAELIGIKWRYVDLALFRSLPRVPENCFLIIEAKRIGAGVEAALGQARGYLEDLCICRDVVVTDGVRYRLYSHANNFEGVAYANLHRLKQPAMDLFRRLGRP